MFVYSIIGDGCDQCSSKLVNHFLSRGRLRAYCAEDEPEMLFRTIEADELDLLIHMPGFNSGMQYEVLARRPAKAIAQWLGCAGQTYARRFIDCTISHWDLWISSSASEPGCFFDNMYPLPFGGDDRLQALPTRNDETARYFGIPVGRRRLCFSGYPFRLRRERIYTALTILDRCGHGDNSPVLYIMYTNGQDMFKSVLCWAEEWRTQNNCKFDMDRILPYRFQIGTEELKRFLVQMDVYLDCYPCGLHTSALDVLALCKCFVARRRDCARWPSLVACTMLEYGGYEELVAYSEQEEIDKAAKFLKSKDETDEVERRMQDDRAALRGMFNDDRVCTNFEIAIPLIVKSVENAGSNRKLLTDIDITGKLPTMPPGGSRLSSPDIPNRQEYVKKCEDLLDAIRKHQYKGSERKLIRNLFLFSKQSGLQLKSLAGTGSSCHAFRGIYWKDSNDVVTKGQDLILKVAHRPVSVEDLGKDPIFRAAISMDASELANPSSEYVIKAVPIFPSSKGPCAAGYVPIGGGKLITFHCCEAVQSNLFDSVEYQAMVDDFRLNGSISEARDRFEQGLFQMLTSFEEIKLYVMDLSLGNMAIGTDGRPRVIDLGSSIVLNGSAVTPSPCNARRKRRKMAAGVHHSTEPVSIGQPVLCTLNEIKDSMSRGGRSQYRNGFGTRTCRSELMAEELERCFRSVPLSGNFAAHFDLSSVAMIVLQGYVPVHNKKVSEWEMRLKEALISPDHMCSFLESELNDGIKPQQPEVLRKRSKMLHSLLSVSNWQQQMTAIEVLQDYWPHNTIETIAEVSSGPIDLPQV